MKKLLTGSILLSLALILPTSIFAQSSYTFDSEENSDEDDFENDDVSRTYVDEDGITHFRSAEQIQEEEFSRDTREEDARRRAESEARLENWKAPVTFGARASVGLNWLAGGDAEIWGWNTGFEFSAGGIMSINLSSMLHIVPEVAIAYRTNSYEYTSEKITTTGDISVWEIDVPLLVRIDIPEGTEILEDFFVEVGPQLGVNLSSSDSYEFGSYEGKDLITPATLEAGLTLGVGYELSREMAVDLRFYRAFTDFAKKTKIFNNKRNYSTMQVNAGFSYMF